MLSRIISLSALTLFLSYVAVADTLPIEDDVLNPEFDKVFVLPKIANEDNIYIALKKFKTREKLDKLTNETLLKMSDEELKALLEKHCDDLKIYLLVQKKPRFVETTLLDEQLRIFLRMNNLVRAQIIQDTRKDNYDEAFDIWAENTKFHQKIISDYPSLVTSSIVMVSYKQNLELLKKVFENKLNKDQKDELLTVLSFKFADNKNGLSYTKTLIVDYYTVVKTVFSKGESMDLTDNKEFMKTLYAEENVEGLINGREVVYLVNNTKNSFLELYHDYDELYSIPKDEFEKKAKEITDRCDSEVKESKVFQFGKSVVCGISVGTSLLPSIQKLDIEAQETLCEMGLEDCAKKK